MNKQTIKAIALNYMPFNDGESMKIEIGKHLIFLHTEDCEYVFNTNTYTGKKTKDYIIEVFKWYLTEDDIFRSYHLINIKK